MKIVKITLWVLGVLLGLVFIVLLIAPDTAAWYINKNGRDLSGRPLSVENINFNIFNGKLEVIDFAIYEPDSADILFHVDSFRVNATFSALFSDKIHLTEISIVNPSINVWIEGDTLSVQDLLPEVDTTNTDTSASEPFPYAVHLENISLKNGAIEYANRDVNREHEFIDIDLSIPGIILDEGDMDVGVDFYFTTGGSLAAESEYNVNTGDFSLDLEIDSLRLAAFTPYVQDYLRVSSMRGRVWIDYHLDGNVSNPVESKLSGTTEVRDFSLKDTADEFIVTVQKTRAKIIEIQVSSQEMLLDTVLISGWESQMVMTQNGNSFMDLIIEKTDDSTTVPVDTTPSQPINYRLNHLITDNGTFTYTDATIRPRFTYPLSDIYFAMHDLKPHAPLVWDASVKVPRRGTISAEGKGSSDYNQYTDIHLDFNDVQLKPFSSYMMQKFGYPIDDGYLSYDGTVVINDMALANSNKIHLYRTTVGDKIESPEPEYNVPLKLGLYIMEDVDDRIEMDLEVEGRVDDPDFSYRKLMFKAFINVLVKVSVSPFKALGSAMGIETEGLEKIEIGAIQQEYRPDQLRKMDELISIMESKPEISLTLTQHLDWEDAVEEWKEYHAKRAYFLSENSGKTIETLNVLDRQKIVEMDEDDPAFESFLNSQLGPELQEASVEDKMHAMSDDAMAQAELLSLMQKRNQLMLDYFVEHNIAADRIEVVSDALEDLKSKSFDSEYAVAIRLGSDVMQTQSQPQTETQGKLKTPEEEGSNPGAE